MKLEDLKDKYVAAWETPEEVHYFKVNNILIKKNDDEEGYFLVKTYIVKNTGPNSDKVQHIEYMIESRYVAPKYFISGSTLSYYHWKFISMEEWMRKVAVINEAIDNSTKLFEF